MPGPTDIAKHWPRAGRPLGHRLFPEQRWGSASYSSVVNRVWKFLGSTQSNWTLPCCLCWKWWLFRRVLSIKGCGKLCRGCSEMGMNPSSICQCFRSKARVNPWLDEKSERTRCCRQELTLGSQTVQTSALKRTCYRIWDKWPPLCASVATPIKWAW